MSDGEASVAGPGDAVSEGSPWSVVAARKRRRWRGRDRGQGGRIEERVDVMTRLDSGRPVLGDEEPSPTAIPIRRPWPHTGEKRRESIPPAS